MAIQLTVDNKVLEKAQKRLIGIPGAYPKAVARAFNRAVESGRAAGAREVSSIYTAKANTVRADFNTSVKAKPGNLYAELKGKGSDLPLTKYLYRPHHDTTGKRRTQAYAAVRKGDLKPLGKAFIYNNQLFMRKGRARLPIKHLYGPSVPWLLGDEQVTNVIIKTMQDTAEQRLDHETLRILEGQG